MRWQDLINVMRVEPTAHRWAQVATWSYWGWVVGVILVFLIGGGIMGLKRVFVSQKKPDENAAFLKSLSQLKPASRAIGFSWILSVLAGGGLLWAWNYTRDPANLLRDLGVSSPWQLSPAGVTALLGRLQTLAWIEILLALSGVAWLLTWLVIRISFTAEEASSPTTGGTAQSAWAHANSIKTPSSPTIGEELSFAKAPEEERPPEAPASRTTDVELPLARAPDAERPPEAPTSPATGEELPFAEAPEEERPPEEPAAPITSGEPPRAPAFFLKLRFTDPSFDPGGIYLDGKFWPVGENRPIHSPKLYVAPDGRHVRTRQRRKWVRLHYQISDKSLVGHEAPDWDGKGEVRFGVESDCPLHHVYDGQHFHVAATRFQFLLTLPYEASDET